MIDEIYMEAILRANKLGACGVRVIDVFEPAFATDDLRLKFVTEYPEPQGAADPLWYEQ